MGTNTVIENKHFTLWYHTESKIIRHCFHKFLHGEPFRECLLAGVELISLYGAQKWLSDDRNNAAIPMEDLEWSTTVWRPKAIEAGWRHWALVLPKSVTGQMSLRDILDKFYGDSPVTYGLFNEPEIWVSSLCW
jgi:hypothetical protein